MNHTAHPTPAVHAPLGVTRVVLVDDHRIVREGLRRILSLSPDIEIVGEADEGHDALALIRRCAPQVAVIDLNMPGLSGMNLVRRIRQEHPTTAVLVLSMYEEQHYAMRALKSGAQGYLSKDTAADELVQAVRKVASGGCHLSRTMAERVAMSLAHQQDAPLHEQLSEREFEVFQLIVAGWRMTDIAEALHLSIKTVSTHKSHLLQKMKMDSTAALIRYGLQHRLFSEGATGAAAEPHQAADLHHTPVTPRHGPVGVQMNDHRARSKPAARLEHDRQAVIPF